MELIDFSWVATKNICIQIKYNLTKTRNEIMSNSISLHGIRVIGRNVTGDLDLLVEKVVFNALFINMIMLDCLAST